MAAAASSPSPTMVAISAPRSQRISMKRRVVSSLLRTIFATRRALPITPRPGAAWVAV